MFSPFSIREKKIPLRIIGSQDKNTIADPLLRIILVSWFRWYQGSFNPTFQRRRPSSHDLIGQECWWQSQRRGDEAASFHSRYPSGSPVFKSHPQVALILNVLLEVWLVFPEDQTSQDSERGLGNSSSAAAKAWTPRWAPLHTGLHFVRAAAIATSTDPGLHLHSHQQHYCIFHLSVCLFGLLVNHGTERGLFHFSKKVNFSSPSVQTGPACPNWVRPSKEFRAAPPQASQPFRISPSSSAQLPCLLPQEHLHKMGQFPSD